MQHNSTIIMILAAIVLLGGAGYWYFSSTNGTDAPLVAVDGSGSEAQSRFQALVSELNPISFDTSIFSDPRFGILINLATPINAESQGRIDPFAVIPGVSAN